MLCNYKEIEIQIKGNEFAFLSIISTKILFCGFL